MKPREKSKTVQKNKPRRLNHGFKKTKKSRSNPKFKKPNKGLVLAFGTFDLLHPGHLFYLAEAKKLGQKLAVIVARDKNVLHFKGRMPVNNEKTRLTVVRALKDVDGAVLGQRSNFFAIIKRFNPEIVALGYDQWPGRHKLRKYLDENGIGARIIRLPAFRAQVYKSTRIKTKIKRFH